VFAPYSPFYTLSWPPSLSHLIPSPLHWGRTCSTLLFNDFVKEKMSFLLFKMATQGLSLWHFHIYMCVCLCLCVCLCVCVL
jgi:hypothetical protein